MTDAERYRPLHDAARRRLDDLAASYRVERVEGSDLDDLPRLGPVDTVVRLTPAGRGAPLTVAFTTFPGLYVRYGRWHVVAYPACGCDACDEDPTRLVEEFEASVDDLVHGRYQERLTRSGRLTHRFGHSGGFTTVDPRGVSSRPRSSRSDWTAWVGR